MQSLLSKLLIARVFQNQGGPGIDHREMRPVSVRRFHGAFVIGVWQVVGFLFGFPPIAIPGVYLIQQLETDWIEHFVDPLHTPDDFFDQLHRYLPVGGKISVRIQVAYR